MGECNFIHEFGLNNLTGILPEMTLKNSGEFTVQEKPPIVRSPSHPPSHLSCSHARHHNNAPTMFTRAFAECAEAAAAPSTSTPLSSLPTPTSPTPTKAPPAEKRNYPGMFSDMSAMAQMILRPDVFDGCRFDIAKGFNEKFAVTHTILLGSSFIQPSGRLYQFGTTFTPNRATMLMGRVNPADGNVKLIAQGLLSERHTLKANCDFNRSGVAEPQPSSGVFNYQWKGDDSSCGLQAQLVEGDDATLKFSVLQALTSKWVAGAEGEYNTGKGSAKAAFGARYAGSDFMASTNYSFAQSAPANYTINCHFMKQVDRKVNLAASLTLVPPRDEASFAVGYVFNLETAKVSATVHSNWSMHATLEEHIAPGFSLLFSGMLDHAKENYKFGVGLSVGQ